MKAKSVWIEIYFQVVTLCFIVQMLRIFFKTVYTTFIKEFFNLYKDIFRIHLTLDSMSKHSVFSKLW